MDQAPEKYYIQSKPGYEYHSAAQEFINNCQINHCWIKSYINGYRPKDHMETETNHKGLSMDVYIEEGSGYECTEYIAVSACHSNGRSSVDVTNEVFVPRSKDFGYNNQDNYRYKCNNCRSRHPGRKRNSNKSNHYKGLPTLDISKIGYDYHDIHIEIKRFLMKALRKGSRRAHLRIGKNPKFRSVLSHYLSWKMYRFSFIGYQKITVYL